MIETSVTHIWALVFFTIVTAADGSRTPMTGPPSFHQTMEACEAAGRDILARIQLAPGSSAHFACVPRGAITDVPDADDGVAQPR